MKKVDKMIEVVVVSTEGGGKGGGGNMAFASQ
jgi:hypothetical protein